MSLTSYDLPTSSVEDTLHLIATYLESITKTNDQIPHDMVTPYHARSIPSISIAAYLNRIHHFCPATNEAYLAALIYLQRATKLGLEHDATYILMDSYSIHRLLITSIMVGAKFFCDLFYTNCRYAKVGGVPVDELNKLEVEFLKLTQFEFTVQPDELQRLGDDLTQFYDYFTLTPPLSGSSTFSSVPNSPPHPSVVVSQPVHTMEESAYSAKNAYTAESDSHFDTRSNHALQQTY
ncbi:cyclin-domain-containing protein [Conidiobolus coronatus NRRL 28638]|uniref:Cyclin-domain-containing protein n=1 Tax=Conidiobolus coronatus (strain ATCC 28846 / CBS 209.66 / NRRL 28638) TaxID=796925 RepID=A0A137NYU8_CONC2|nr:cyclin-domain-containing protein [Conidiobolus coronatus NRRL 28638]|eukprot:KXN68010.1 cyclin-domain-containing protein [Conidiobolus coronatus NRRL 28638]